jgi:hypothetical protein
MVGPVLLEPFRTLAAVPDPPLDELLLALAAEFRPVDARTALLRLDQLAAQVDPLAVGVRAESYALVDVLEGFEELAPADPEPAQLMLDVVLEERRGNPLMLDAIRREVARRASIAVAGLALTPAAIALAVLDALVPAYEHAYDLTNAIHAARLRLILPTPAPEVTARNERVALALLARLN